MDLRGRSHTTPESLLKDDAVTSFVEIDLVGHEGGNAIGDHAYTLTGSGSCSRR